MKTITAGLMQQRLKELLRYDLITGQFSWLQKPNRRVVVGQIAGRKSGRYVQIRIDGIAYYAHRLAWLYMKGEWPADEVDHKNRNGLDNGWINLRPATRGQNQSNMGESSANTSGVKGVSWHNKDQRWLAKVGKDGKDYIAGRFKTFEDAAIAVKALRAQLHGDFANA